MKIIQLPRSKGLKNPIKPLEPCFKKLELIRIAPFDPKDYRKTLRQLAPDHADLKRLGEVIAEKGIKRIGRKIKEDGFMVNIYHCIDFGSIQEIASKPLNRKRLKLNSGDYITLPRK